MSDLAESIQSVEAAQQQRLAKIEALKQQISDAESEIETEMTNINLDAQSLAQLRKQQQVEESEKTVSKELPKVRELAAGMNDLVLQWLSKYHEMCDIAATVEVGEYRPVLVERNNFNPLLLPVVVHAKGQKFVSIYHCQGDQQDLLHGRLRHLSEMCGKDVVQQFEASVNNFQDFKQR